MTPKKAKETESEKRLNVRLPESEHTRWVSLASDRGLTVSQLIRMAVNKNAKTRPPSAPPKRARIVTNPVDPALLLALAKIGTNLNQVARIANQKGDLPTLTHLAAIERALKSLRPDSDR